MGLDETVNLERLATAFERIASALETMSKIQLDSFAKLYPEREKRAAVIDSPDKEKRDHFSDRAEPGWFDETEAALPSRFQKKFDASNQAKPIQKRRRVVEVPKKQ
jgi:hypothetical protein